MNDSMELTAEILDTRGLRSPYPLQKIALRYVDMKEGDILEVIGDCPSFERDVRLWCERVKKRLLFCNVEDDSGTIRCKIQV